MVAGSVTCSVRRAGFLGLTQQSGQSGQSRVDVVFVMVMVRRSVEVLATRCAEACAVLPAERCDRLGQGDRLAHRMLEVELVVLIDPQRVWLLGEVHRGAG